MTVVDESSAASEDEAQARAAHRHSSLHREEIDQSVICGCFHCLRTFAPSGITEWIEERRSFRGAVVGYTANCPFCGIDSVIGSASGFPITPEFLAVMHRVWF